MSFMPPQAGQGPGGPPPDPMAGAGAPPPPGAALAPDPMQAGGAPQFPSADANAVSALLSTLVASDQQKLGELQVQAVGGAFSQMMQAMPDPNAAAAMTAGGTPAPPPDSLGGPSAGPTGY